MQVRRKDHISFALQKKKQIWLSLRHLTILQQNKNPDFTAIIQNHSVKGQHLITSRWSQPTFKK